jgi:hypothetical protein
MIARLERVETGFRVDIERTGNAVAAYVGELGDRLVRGDHSGPASH